MYSLMKHTFMDVLLAPQASLHTMTAEYGFMVAVLLDAMAA